MNEIKKTTLHPDNQPNTDLYPKTSIDQIEGLNNIITGINNEIEKKVNTVDNFVRIFTIPNGVNSGTLTADVKEKLCNPDGHNYYVYDDTSEMILKYSFNSENQIIIYRAVYLHITQAYEITMQIFPSNGRWSRKQTVLNVPASTGGKLYLHSLYFSSVKNKALLAFYHTSPTKVTDEWIYENLANNNCCLTFFPTVNSISQYTRLGLGAKLGQTSSSPSWGASIDLESPSPTTLSVSQADQYIVTEL